MQINSNYPWLMVNGAFLKLDEVTTIQLEAPMIYEVIRIIGGKPLFYEAHMARLSESAQLLGVSIEALESQIHRGISALINKNGILQDNLKLVIGNLKEAQPKWCVFGVEGFYPPESWFEQGIKTTLIQVLRHNPHAKVINQTLADQVNQLRANTDIFEALLVDEQGRVTEGSRSNVFFIKDGRLLTPRTELALKGITRMKLLEAAASMGLVCEEVDIEAQALDTYEGVFITGTSIDLLPVSEVDKVTFNTAQLPLMQALLANYRQLMKDSLTAF